MHTNYTNDDYLALDELLETYLPDSRQDGEAWGVVHRALLRVARDAKSGDLAAVTTTATLAAALRAERGEVPAEPLPVDDCPLSEDEHDHTKHWNDPCYAYLDHECGKPVEAIVTFADPDHGLMTIAVCGAHHARLSSDCSVKIETVTIKTESGRAVA